MTTGMVSSFMTEILALAAQREITIRDIRLTLDNYYTMEGSARQGTMTGGARSPELEVEIDADADRNDLVALAAQAVDASPINGLLRHVHHSLFTLVHNGRRIPTGRVAELSRPPEPDPCSLFDQAAMAPVQPIDEPIRKLVEAEQVEGVPGGAKTSLQEHQSRTLHVRGVCTVRGDGVKVIEQSLFAPIGSTFRYLSDEAPEFGGKGLAPDAATYLSAGIGFCFMTQLGRYADIMRRDLGDYRICQDTFFSPGGASGGTGSPGVASPVETHLYVDTGEDDEFARMLLDMGEQTCFLHALCRTEVRAKVRVRQGLAV